MKNCSKLWWKIQASPKQVRKTNPYVIGFWRVLQTLEIMGQAELYVSVRQ